MSVTERLYVKTRRHTIVRQESVKVERPENL